MNAREKKIYALAQKWAKARKNPSPASGDYQINYARADQRKDCAKALLKLFPDRP